MFWLFRRTEEGCRQRWRLRILNSSRRMVKFSRRMLNSSRRKVKYSRKIPSSSIRMVNFSNKAQNFERELFNSTGN